MCSRFEKYHDLFASSHRRRDGFVCIPKAQSLKSKCIYANRADEKLVSSQKVFANLVRTEDGFFFRRVTSSPHNRTRDPNGTDFRFRSRGCRLCTASADYLLSKDTIRLRTTPPLAGALEEVFETFYPNNLFVIQSTQSCGEDETLTRERLHSHCPAVSPRCGAGCSTHDPRPSELFKIKICVHARMNIYKVR